MIGRCPTTAWMKTGTPTNGCPGFFVPAGTDRRDRISLSEQQVRRGDPVDVDQVVELVGNPLVPKLILPSQRTDVAELRAVDPFKGG